MSSTQIFSEPTHLLTHGELRTQLKDILELSGISEAHPPTGEDVSALLSRFFKLSPNSLEVDNATDTVFDLNKTANRDALKLVSTHITKFLIDNVPDITLTPQQDGSLVSEPLYPKIEKMLEFVSRTAYFQVGELIYAGALIRRLVEVDMEEGRPVHEWIVSSCNIGTVLVVALMLSNKMNRDVPVRNSWWAKTFNIPLDVLNNSEAYFLAQLNYSLSPTAEFVGDLVSNLLEAYSA
ncbi:hypothetical protein BLNAU_14379 [Blattamonas nauphoetae]|uniref:Uncharacterized protein n=1 Tax=Blattamonas nauphoetae TaxID=2049346 RepID=A0ABQ9XE06_9EUKA|nr:hypothetical protein BLNAU_14379 [Blattamonas nauphoetae]